MSPRKPLIDSHIHLWSPSEVPNLVSIADGIGAERMSIASVMDRKNVNDNPALYAAKAEYPERFYIFPGLNHSAHFSGGRISTPSYAEQVDIAIALGADGFKLLETKPDRRKWVDIAMDDACYEPMFARLEETGLPVLWHVADPEEFWDPATTPEWARKRNWGYNETFVPKEQFYSEVERVLERHPRLVVIFAHFYFLSADLPRAAALFERFKGVHFDLAPGVEMLHNLSRDPAASREFFVKHADRIIFGTDIEGSQSISEAGHRAGVIVRWLESGDEFRVPEGADYLLGPPEDGVMRGLSLPEDVLTAIYAGNFERLTGPTPKPLDRELAAQECDRISRAIVELGGDPSRAL